MSHDHHTSTRSKHSTTKTPHLHDVSHDVIKENSTVENSRGSPTTENSQGAAAEKSDEEMIIVTKPKEEGNSIEVYHETSGSKPAAHESEPPPTETRTFDIQSFPKEVSDLTVLFASDRFTRVDANYPVDEVVSAVSAVDAMLSEYRSHTLTSQETLEQLRAKMAVIRDNIHSSVKKRAFQLDSDNKYQSEEEIALTEKLSRLNAELSRANVQLAEVVKLAAETESTAIQAAKVAQESSEEAGRIREEMESRAASEARRKDEELERHAEEARLRGEQERKTAEEKRQRELEWKKRETSVADDAISSLPLFPFESPMGSEFSVYCVVRARSSKFDDSAVSCDSVDQSGLSFVYGPQEEIVSPLIQLMASRSGYSLTEPVSVCIPFVTSRLTALTREPLVKAWDGAQWTELFTKEVTLDSYKEYKFAQAEIKSWCTLTVVTRLKRDYKTIDPCRAVKVTSSAEHRVTVTIPECGLVKREHLVLQVQPIDSASLQDMKGRNKSLNNLLTSSPIVYIDWQRSVSFKASVSVTVPCPPNPAKAKKMAAIRAQKEAKMNNPARMESQDNLDATQRLKAERAKKRSQALAEATEGEVVRKRDTRWYMGVYGAGDDDESDRLVLLQCYPSGRWSVNHDVIIQQVKMDLLQFETLTAMDKFIILRTRITVEENDDEALIAMATAMDDYVSRRSVNVIVKQRSNDPFDAILHVVPNRKCDRTLQSLEVEKYTEGPSIDREVLVKEGDIIELEFRGNVAPVHPFTHTLIYNSHLKTSASITLGEVDRYLQKDFSSFHGLMQVYRKFRATDTKPTKIDQKARARKASMAVHMVAPPVVEEDRPIVSEYQRELITTRTIHIPKAHVGVSTAPRKVNVVIETTDAVNEATLRRLSVELGGEWQRLAHYLNVRRTRVQAILRNSAVGERSEEEARYDMLVTWWKRVPRASNKADMLSQSLDKCGRHDLASEIRLSNKTKSQIQLSA